VGCEECAWCSKRMYLYLSLLDHVPTVGPKTQEFADYMRTLIRSKMPIMVARIHRMPDTEIPPSHNGGDAIEWSWNEAEKRIWEAYDRDGFMGWMRAALVETEEEAKVERAKRGLGRDTNDESLRTT
jgi:hypothetical protein